MFDLIMYFLKNKKILSYQKINNKIATISTSYKYDDFDLLTLKFDDNCIAKITSNFACVFPHSHFLKFMELMELSFLTTNVKFMPKI